MSMANRVLAWVGVAVSCGGLVLGLAGVEQILTWSTLQHNAAPAMALALATLAGALVVCAAGCTCLFLATRQPHPPLAPGASRRQRDPHGAVTL